MGTELLTMRDVEVNLKQRFFDKVAEGLEEDLVARFLSMRDYLFTMAKLNVWSKSRYASRYIYQRYSYPSVG